MARRVLLRGVSAGLGAAGLGGLAAPALAHPKPNTITVLATAVPLTYRIEVSGEIAKGPASGTTDAIVDGRVEGSIRNREEIDDYRFSGSVTAFEVVEGAAEVRVNGRVVADPVGLPAGPLPNRALVAAGDAGVRYRFAVTGRVEKGSLADGAGDAVTDGTTVTGTVGPQGRDDYRFSGGIRFEDVDGPLTVTLAFDGAGDP